MMQIVFCFLLIDPEFSIDTVFSLIHIYVLKLVYWESLFNIFDVKHI